MTNIKTYAILNEKQEGVSKTVYRHIEGCITA